jgi:hypothetical protein
MLILPSSEWERRSISAAGQHRPAQQVRGLGRVHHEDQAGALPGSGTSVNGPDPVWNSVEVSACGRACAG